MEGADGEAVAVGDRLDLVETLVPDTKARGGAPRVGALRRSAPEPRVHANGDRTARRRPTERIELEQGAGVHDDAARDVFREPTGWHLGRELDLAGREAGGERALHLPVTRGVDVKSEIAEQREDAAARISLHGVPQREPVRRWERQR